jgi:hypothetical protein
MNQKYFAAFSFAAFVFCALFAIKIEQGIGLLADVSLAAFNGFFFIFNLCRFAEAIVAPPTDADAKVEARPATGIPS